MKIRTVITLCLVLSACSKSSPKVDESPPEVVDNAATRYVNELQMDVRKAESAVNRMNRAVEKTEKAVSETQSE